MSNEQRMCICGHQRRTHDRRDQRVRWGGCWGLRTDDPDPPHACPCEGFMWVGTSQLAKPPEVG